METTIRISREVKKRLDRFRMYRGETYNDLIESLLEDHMEINEKTKKELSEARKRVAKGEYYTQEEVEKRLGL